MRPRWQTRPHAQTGRRANWLTDGGDPQRTSWQRNETLISPATVRDMTLIWKVKLDNQPRQMHNLFAPLIISDLQVAGGPREIAIVAGISDNIYGIDVEKGTQIWKRHFDSTFDDTGRDGGPLCPGGQTATPIAVPTETPGKYKRLRHLVGRTAPHAGSGHRRGDRAAPSRFSPPTASRTR